MDMTAARRASPGNGCDLCLSYGGTVERTLAYASVLTGGSAPSHDLVGLSFRRTYDPTYVLTGSLISLTNHGPSAASLIGREVAMAGLAGFHLAPAEQGAYAG